MNEKKITKLLDSGSTATMKIVEGGCFVANVYAHNFSDGANGDISVNLRADGTAYGDLVDVYYEGEWDDSHEEDIEAIREEIEIWFQDEIEWITDQKINQDVQVTTADFIRVLKSVQAVSPDRVVMNGKTAQEIIDFLGV